MNIRNGIALLAVSLGPVFGTGCTTAPEKPIVLEAVIGNNFGHLPMFVGVEKGLFKRHGIDLKLKVVNTGTDMVSAMTKREVQIGDMSVTTFLKARHAGSPFLVVGMIMNDATTTYADNPLAIIATKGSGITKVEDLKGKRIGLAKEQTSDEYLKMVLARRGLNYGEMNIQSIMAPPALVNAFAAGKVDVMVSWEPFNTMGLMRNPGSYEVLRGGGHLSYMMIATVHDPLVQENPRLIQAFINGLAAASHYTRNNRPEAVEIFSKWVPNVNLDVARKAIQHISYDPRFSRQSLQAFENAQNELLKLTIKGAKPIPIRKLVLTSYTEAAQHQHPEYFSDLPAVR